MRPPGNDLILGKLPGRNRRLGLSATGRDKHLYVCGGTETGKSKFLENLIRKDIRNWSKSKCGMLVIGNSSTARRPARIASSFCEPIWSGHIG